MRFTVSLLLVFAAACASAPPKTSTVLPPVPEITWEQKLGWMMRLEDRRILRDPHPPAPAVLAAATPTRPALLALPEPTDILPLLGDAEARVRRRAAQAAGRAGLREAVPGLIPLLTDPEFEVRQMAAFSLGLLGDVDAAPALVAALADVHPIVQGRAAEALGRLGRVEDAAPVAGMVRAHVEAGAVRDRQPDDEQIGQGPADAVRLGVLALGRLAVYDALASVAVDGRGQPISAWWPFAAALRSVQDSRSTPALRALASGAGRYARTFAIQALGALKAREALPDLLRMLAAVPTDRGLATECLRALRQIGGPEAGAALLTVAGDPRADTALRIEALDGLGALPPATGTVDALLDLVSEPDPYVRAAAFRALASADVDAFMAAIASMSSDPHWVVRAAQADGLATLGAGRGLTALFARLGDEDQRVVAPVVRALAGTGASEAVPALVAALAADDLVVRAEAARGLGRLKAAQATERLLAAVEDWRTEPHYQPRVAALEALVSLEPAAAAEPLRAALADRDWAVRVRAAELLATADAEMAIRPAPVVREVPVEEWQWLLAPPYSPHARLELDRGIVELELDVTGAPRTVANFMALARQGFFDGVPVHRVVPNFVVQAGDPRGDGEGGPGYTIRDELNPTPYVRGTVGMALDWRDTGGSQFFIALGPQPHLDGRYTAFARVVDGLAIAEAIQKGDVIRRVTVWDGRDAAAAGARP